MKAGGATEPVPAKPAPAEPVTPAPPPLRFEEVLGQAAPIRALSRAAASGSLAASYIFSGTRGIGKTTIARVFAKALNCEKGPAEDCCADCTPCTEIAEGRSLDVLDTEGILPTALLLATIGCTQDRVDPADGIESIAITNVTVLPVKS